MRFIRRIVLMAVALSCLINGIGCSRNEEKRYIAVGGFSVSDISDTVYFTSRDVIRIRVTKVDGKNVLYFQLTGEALERYLRLKEGAVLNVNYKNKKLAYFEVKREIGTGVGGFAFALPDDILPEGKRLSEIILRKE